MLPDLFPAGEADCVIAVCDATSLERSSILALQVLELTDRAFVCVNLMDEAQKQGIRLDLAALSFELGVPVVAVSAGRKRVCRSFWSSCGGFSTALRSRDRAVWA